MLQGTGLDALKKRFLWIPLILLTAYSFGTRNLSDCYDKVIMAEGHGYYTYLLSTYIYDDPTFSFFNDLYPDYYCPGFDPPTRNFINEFDGIRVNKYYPGVSLLWLPFFLVAHLIAVISGLPADGYSDIYQYAIAIAGISYTSLGFYFLRRILERFRLSFPVQVLVIIGLLFGTNLLIYSGAWASQTHAYSFFLVSILSWNLFRLFDEADGTGPSALPTVLVLSALLITVRPQDAALYFLLPFFGASLEKTKHIVRRHLFTRQGMIGMLVAALVLFRVMYYWKLQTGRWYLYPYHGESYDLFSPHLADILFSFRKGWLLYSPLVVVGLCGIFFFSSRKQRINLSLFWFLLIYISSCWWCWTYSQTSFGQRTFVDFYPLIGLQAGMFLERLRNKRTLLVAVLFVAACIGLNLLQTHQYRIGVLDGDLTDGPRYLRNFLVTDRSASYPIPEKSILRLESVVEGFDSSATDHRIVPTNDGNGKSTIICDSVVFSQGLNVALPGFLVGDEFSHVRVTTRMKAPYGIDTPAKLVMDLQHDGVSFGYSSHPIAPYLHDREWTMLEFGMQVPHKPVPGDMLKVYGWNSAESALDTVFIDEIRVDFIQADSSYFLEKH